MRCACGGAVVHKMCVMCVWRACKSALAPMRCIMRVWRACKSSLAPLTSTHIDNFNAVYLRMRVHCVRNPKYDLVEVLA